MQTNFITLDALTDPPTEFRLFRAGDNETLKGTFVFDAGAAAAVEASAAEWGVRFAIDYNHAMLGAARAPDPAEAGKSAGSFRVEVRNGELWAADVQWTAKARAAILAKEYRYISPAFEYDEDNHVTRIINVALTNIPATKNLDPLTLAVTAPEDDPAMNKLFLARLGLPLDATEDRAVEAVDALQTLAAELSAITGKRERAEAMGTVHAWRAAHAELAAARADLAKRDAADNARDIEAAVQSGRLAPAQREWAEKYGAENAAGLRAFLSAAPVLVRLDAKTESPAVTAALAVSPEDRLVAAMLGITVEDMVKRRAPVAQ